MNQIALPLRAGKEGPSRIVVGNANSAALEAMATWLSGRFAPQCSTARRAPTRA